MAIILYVLTLEFGTMKRSQQNSCADDFDIKYTNTAHDQHIFNTLQKYYKISINWEETITVDLL